MGPSSMLSLRALRGAALALSMAALAPPAAAAAPSGPNPQLTPAQAVRIQLAALARNDEPAPDAGIAAVWRFASPGNRAQTGPQARFTRMVHQGYAELLNHRSATLAALSVDGDQAFQGVDLVDHDGIAHRFVFVLSRQADGPCRGCWLTDAVIGAPDETPRVTARL